MDGPKSAPFLSVRFLTLLDCQTSQPLWQFERHKDSNIDKEILQQNEEEGLIQRCRANITKTSRSLQRERWPCQIVLDLQTSVRIDQPYTRFSLFQIICMCRSFHTGQIHPSSYQGKLKMNKNYASWTRT